MSKYFNLEMIGNFDDCILKETTDGKTIIRYRDEYFLCPTESIDSPTGDLYLAKNENQYFLFNSYAAVPTKKMDLFSKKHDILFITKVEEGDILEMLTEIFGEDLERKEE